MNSQAHPTMIAPRLRPGVLSDLPALAEVEREASALFPPGSLPCGSATTTPTADLTAGVTGETLWVAESPGGLVVGFLLATSHGASLHILEMDVSPEYGRQGFGTALLHHACEVAASRGLRSITLTTFEHLPWNAPFYARHGFAQVHEFQSYPHLEEALAHELALGFKQRIAMAKSTT